MRKVDWKREWEEERTLTPEELKERAREEAKKRADYEEQLLLAEALNREERQRELDRQYLYLDDCEYENYDYPL